MTMKLGESGKVFRVNTGFDISAYTSLELVFTKPDGSSVSVTDPRVTAPSVAGGGFNADEYMEFTTNSTDFDTAGIWRVYAKFTNTTPDPDQIYLGDEVGFKVVDES